MTVRIHLDHNATTPLRPEARERWLEVAGRLRGNPSSLHAGGRWARAVIDEARAQIAEALGVGEDELLFTSGGTEANNLAIAGGLRARAARLGAGEPPPALVTTAVEHSSVLEAARAMERRGHPLRFVEVDRTGRPVAESLASALAGAPPAALVSITAANNEVGAVSDLRRLAGCLDRAGGPRPTFHTDAVQALGRLPVNLGAWGVDLATFSAHKVGGPVGVGLLWRRSGTPLEPMLHGGAQEGGLRAGTEDAASIAAAAEAIRLAVAEREAFARRTGERLRELWRELERRVPGITLLGPRLPDDERPTDAPTRLPNTLCVSVPRTDGKVLVTRLDLVGIEASAGSACASGSIEPSHVLLAMGLDEDAARAGLRLSLGRDTSREECMQAADLLCDLFVSSHAT